MFNLLLLIPLALQVSRLRIPERAVARYVKGYYYPLAV
jgi:hypothetical protein